MGSPGGVPLTVFSGRVLFWSLGRGAWVVLSVGFRLKVFWLRALKGSLGGVSWRSHLEEVPGVVPWTRCPGGFLWCESTREDLLERVPWTSFPWDPLVGVHWKASKARGPFAGVAGIWSSRSVSWMGSHGGFLVGFPEAVAWVRSVGGPLKGSPSDIPRAVPFVVRWGSAEEIT
jgi:hypothetical protein